MAGYQAVLSLRRLEQDVDALGFMLCNPKHGNWGGDDFSDRVAVKPKDADSLPIYTRDAELFVGTLEQLKIWIQGVRWAREYDMMLKLSDDKKRTKKEADERARQIARQLDADQKKFITELKKDHTKGISK
jgi:hypothetical protein